MSLKKNRERLKIIDQLIQTKTEGNIHFLAKKFRLSTSGTRKILEDMKEVGFPIAYSKHHHRYYYSTPGRMVGFVFVKDIEDNDAENEENSGGRNLF